MNVSVPSFLLGSATLATFLFVRSFVGHMIIRMRFPQEEDFPILSQEAQKFRLKLEAYQLALEKVGEDSEKISCLEQDWKDAQKLMKLR
jgi:hypothetical protein